jgi:hypothetical protein
MCGGTTSRSNGTHSIPGRSILNALANTRSFGAERSTYQVHHSDLLQGRCNQLFQIVLRMPKARMAAAFCKLG